MDAQGVRTLRADWTTKDELLTKLMHKLMGGAPQLPLLAIFPGNQPNRPIVLKTYYTQAQVVEELKQAGSSRGTDSKSPDQTKAEDRPETTDVVDVLP